MRDTRLGRGRMGVVMVLMLLASIFAPMTAFAAPAQNSPQNSRGNTEWVEVYTVQRGDTLSGIALSFGVTEEALMEANSIRKANLIYVGQQLIIPEKSSHGKGGPVCADYYTVRRGDTLSEIALYRGIDAYALARANGLYDLNDIYVGQTLCIPGSGNQGSGNQGGGEKPQQPKPEPERPVNEGCNPCGQPQNDGPKNDGPQRPTEGQGCSGPCGQPQNDGPKNEGPQRPPEGQPCSGPCGGPQNEGPKNEGPQRPAEGPGCGNSCGGPKPEGPRPTETWKGTYFKDKYFGEFGFERQDLEVNFNWFTSGPFGDENKDRFSVRWEKVEYFKGGPYRFYATADDGVRVYVDDQLIIDGWVIQPATDYKADLHLSEGPHKIVVEYYEEAEDAQIRVYWEPKRPGHDK